MIIFLTYLAICFSAFFGSMVGSYLKGGNKIIRTIKITTDENGKERVDEVIDSPVARIGEKAEFIGEPNLHDESEALDELRDSKLKRFLDKFKINV